MTFDPQAEFILRQLSAANPARESIVYTPTGGTAKTIYAVVNRGGMKSVRSKIDKMPSIYDYEILISTSTASGIAAVTSGKDTVTMTMHEINGSNIFTVAGIIARNAACWHLGLRP